MANAQGFGWRLTAFDPATRTGEVSLRDKRLVFDRSASADEELRVGEPVYVCLKPSSEPNVAYVARVWPCLARVRAPADVLAVSVPLLGQTIADATRRVLTQVGELEELVIFDRGGGQLSIVALEFDASGDYLVGHDVTVQGAVICKGARPTLPRLLEAPRVRLAQPEERAVVHAHQRLARDHVVIALVEPRHEFWPDHPAEVALVTCAEVAWQPGPKLERARAARKALEARPFASVSAVMVEDGKLVTVTAGRHEPFFALTDAVEAAAFGPWCDAVTTFLREDVACVELDALRVLREVCAGVDSPFTALPMPATRCPDSDELDGALEAMRAIFEALARWLDAMDHMGVRAAPTGAMSMLPELFKRIGIIHTDLHRAGIPQSEKWHATFALLDELSYLGATHAGGGLLARLDDGRRWSEADVAKLHELAARARALAAG